MDGVLSEFIARTSADPGLAADLLDGHEWNLQSALSAYYVMKGILPGEMPSSEGRFISKQNKLTKITSHSMKPLYEEDCIKTNVSTRPLLKKLNSVDIEEDNNKKLTRGISRATENVGLVTKARNEFAQDFGTSVQNWLASQKLEVPDYTFTLPDLSVYPVGLREYLERDLIETSTLVSLEHAGRLNWWYTKNICHKLWPLATTGDGNCLLHAASLGMWGFHDRLLTLRKALHTLLTCSSLTDAFYRRWRWQTTLQNKEAGLIYCEEEWQKEWLNLLKMASTEPRPKSFQRCFPENSGFSNSHASLSEDEQSEVYESLEELHVLALAHVLRRPVIVIADTVLKDVTGEPFAPIPFGGIYLPLECQPSECHRSPLCLTYDSAHFSALVPMDEELRDGEATLKAAIPITDPDNKLLPLQFAIDPGLEVRWGQDENDPWVIARLTLTDKEKLILLNEYLDIQNIPVEHEDTECTIESYEKMNGVTETKKSLELYESDESLNDASISCTGGKHHKSKAARQLQTVAKQFGSIGKSVSRKLRNIGNIARRGNSFKGESEAYKQTGNGLKSKRTLSGLPMLSRTSTINGNFNPNQVIVAVLHTERKHEYQKEMIQNYLSSALTRFQRDKELKCGINIMQEKPKAPTVPVTECINPGCTMYGSAATSYLCFTCYNKQKQQEVEMEGRRQVLLQQRETKSLDGPIMTFGKSAFYMESDKNMIESVERVPLAVSLSNKPYQGQNNSIFYDKFIPESMQINPSSLPDRKERVVYVDSGVMHNNYQ